MQHIKISSVSNSTDIYIGYVEIFCHIKCCVYQKILTPFHFFGVSFLEMLLSFLEKKAFIFGNEQKTYISKNETPKKWEGGST